MMARVVRTAVVLLVLVGLSACGMRPLYGSSATSGNVAQSLSSINIPEPDTRLAQLIRNDLLSHIRPAGQAGGDRYVLILKPTEKSNDIIDQQQPKPSRQQVFVTVDYQLLENGNELTGGRTFSQVSYDTVRQPYADVQAQVDAEKRVALELSSDIRTRLAAYFASH